MDPGVKNTIKEAEERGRDITKFGSKDAPMPPRVELNEWGARVAQARGWIKGLNASVFDVMTHLRVPEDRKDDFLYCLAAIEAGMQEEQEKRQRRR